MLQTPRSIAGFVSLAASFLSLPLFVVVSENILSPSVPALAPWAAVPIVAVSLLYPFLIAPILLFLFFFSIRSRVQLSKVGVIEYVISLFTVIAFFAFGAVFVILFSPVSNGAALSLGLLLAWKRRDKKAEPELAVSETISRIVTDRKNNNWID
jgi:hypothetical protein